MRELKEMVDTMGSEFEKFCGRSDKRVGDLEKQLNVIETAVARSEFPGGGRGGSSRSDGAAPTAAAREHKEKFNAWMRKGADPEGLRSAEKAARVQAGLSTDSDPDGGFLIETEIEKNIERLALASVAMRRISRVVKSKGEYSKPLSKGGATGGWVAERASRPETDTPELTLFSPPMCEIYAMPSATQKVLDMSDFDVEAWLTEEINDVFVATEGAGFVTGNGVGQVKGIIDSALMIANSAWVYGKTGYIAGGHASLLNSVDSLISLQHALLAAYRENGTWLMSDETASVVRRMKDGDGNFLWRGGLLEGAPDILLGKPVAISDFMPPIGANAYPIAFGDFRRAYTIVDHVSGIRLLRDPFSVKGKVLFYVTKRLAAGISNSQAVKFLKIAV